MKRFVFEFTNEENDRATEEFYLLKNVETAKSDFKTLCCVFAMMPLLLVFLYIIGSFREEDLGVILGLCVVVIIAGAITIFRLMYFGGAVPLGEIYNKEVRPSEEFQKSKKQLIFDWIDTGDLQTICHCLILLRLNIKETALLMRTIIQRNEK